MAIIILTIYALFVTLLWGVSLGRQLQREKMAEFRRENQEKLNNVIKELGSTIIFPEASIEHAETDPGMLNILNEMSKDMKASLQASKAVVETMVEIKDAAKKAVADVAIKSPDFYVQSLEYARDNFASKGNQKIVLNTIIKTIRDKHAK
jgi:hypothetical protein